MIAVTFEKNRLAAELAERERKYRLLAENTSDVIFIQNMEFDIVYISPSVERVFGYTQEEASRLTMDRYLTPDSLRRAIGSFREYAICARTEKTNVPLMEFQYVRKDGSLFWGEFKAQFLYDAEGKLSGSQGVLRDITARKTAMDEKLEIERSLRHSEKLQSIGQLTGGIAHDFNNQLMSMCANADLIIMNCGDNEDARGFAAEIKKAIDRSSSLISRLLTVSRKGEINPVALDVHTVLDDIILIMSRSTNGGIVIEKQFGAESPYVFADRAQFFNAILNLCINARDAMPSGGTIRLSTENTVFDRSDIRGYCAVFHSDLKGSVVRIAVSDTGEGIDEEILARIFEPFFTTKENGIGMGLASVVGMVQRHRGSLSVHSARHEGAHFSVYLASVPPADIELSRRR